MASPPLPNTHAPLARPHISPPNRPLRPLLAAKAVVAASPTSPSSPTQSPAAVDDDRCVYRATACANPRARKASGERHKFCQFHLRQTSLTQRAAQCQRKQSKTLLFRDPSRVPAALLRQVPQTKRPHGTVSHASPHAQVLPRLRSHDVLRRALLTDAQRLPLLAAAVALVRSREPAGSACASPAPSSSSSPRTSVRLPSIHSLDASSRREWTHLAPLCVPRSPRLGDNSPRVLPSLNACSSPFTSSHCLPSNSTSA